MVNARAVLKLKLEHIIVLQAVSLPSVAWGRAMLLAKELDALRRKTEILLADTRMDGTTRREAEDLKSRINQTAGDTPDWLATCDLKEVLVPANVAISAPGWTAIEFLQVVKPLYPLAESITSAQRFIALMHDRVRRLPNPEHESRFSGDPLKAAEFLFDRTEALIYAANHWGGPECLLQAALASQEMGRLRDPRFVFPALAATSFESRLAGVACLAFVWSDEGTAKLKLMAEEDPDRACGNHRYGPTASRAERGRVRCSAIRRRMTRTSECGNSPVRHWMRTMDRGGRCSNRSVTNCGNFPQSQINNNLGLADFSTILRALPLLTLIF